MKTEDTLLIARAICANYTPNQCQEWVDFSDVPMEVILPVWREMVAQAIAENGGDLCQIGMDTEDKVEGLILFDNRVGEGYE